MNRRVYLLGVLTIGASMLGSSVGFAATGPLPAPTGEPLPHECFAIHADISALPDADREEALRETARVLALRADLYGLTEVYVRVAATDLVVELPEARSSVNVRTLLGTAGVVDFREERIVDGGPSWVVAAGRGTDGREKPFTSQYIGHAELALDPTPQLPQILIEFDPEGTALFADITRRLVRQQLGVFVDGEPWMTPRVQEAITSGRVRITGNFTVEEARVLVIQINAGALPVPISLADKCDD